MPVRAYLYDAAGTDKEVTLDKQLVTNLHENQLLWVDVTAYNEVEIRQIGALLGLHRDSIYNILQPGRRPRLDNYGSYFQFNILTIQEEEGRSTSIELNFVLGCNLLMTIHQEPAAFLDHFDQQIKGDSELGQLDAPAFLAAILDWHITSYFRIIEQLQAQVDRIDAHALRPRHTRNLLKELARLHLQVAVIRRTLTPHREVYAAMARPDFHLLAGSESTSHYAMLNDRLERAIESAENARELLVGSFDIFTTQTTLRTNEVIKVLTLVSVVLLPASLIVSIVSLLIKPPVYSVGPAGFWWMLAAIVVIAIVTVAIARWRRWI